MPQQPSDAVDGRVVKALSHPTRGRILALLQERELASPVELAALLEMPLGTVSYHVRRLETLGFIELATRTQRRGAIEHHYRACAAIGKPPRRRRAVAAAVDGTAPAADALVLSALEDAHRALPRGGFDALQARADGRALVLDARGREQLRVVLARWEKRLSAVREASARRMALADGAGGAPHAATAVVLLVPLRD